MKASAGLLSLRIWFLTSLALSGGIFIFSVFWGLENWWWFIPAFIISGLGSIPVFFVMLIGAILIGKWRVGGVPKMASFATLCFCSALVYCLLASAARMPWFGGGPGTGGFLRELGLSAAILFSCVAVALLFSRYYLVQYFSPAPGRENLINQKQNMETVQTGGPWSEPGSSSSSSGKILIKGLITGGLILVMMIPTVFISNLVTERAARQQEVAAEVSSRWAGSQTLTGPYVYLPYKVTTKGSDGKATEFTTYRWMLPEELHVSGSLQPEIRPRSIYKVLLYRASLHDSGRFHFQLPSDIDQAMVQWKDAKICFRLTDFKGIEEKLSVHFNGTDYDFAPGLPTGDESNKGLSTQINLSPAELDRDIPFSMDLKIKGSGFLHLVPLAGNSDYELKSGWSNPSFDGNNLPSERSLGESGFDARWTFNKANLPFSTTLRDFEFEKTGLAFGVAMVQPADQYAKTSRSVKYAILIIGLSFSLFFIVELMQKKPVHPVQYILIGLALVIFYTLLLSISEFLLFDIAYLIAAFATVMLINLYVRSHFRNWRPALIFGAVLSLLYGFIFILIRLEDTALLVGSIGLFVILALVMYASRNINWYGQSEVKTA